MKKEIITALLFLGLTACENYPKDPLNSFNSLSNRPLKVGVIHSPPYVDVSTPQVTGSEVSLLQEFSSTIDSEVQFKVFGSEEAFEALEKYEIDLLIGNLTKKSSNKKVGFTRPYDKSHVIGVAPGENRMVIELETYLKNKELTE